MALSQLKMGCETNRLTVKVHFPEFLFCNNNYVIRRFVVLIRNMALNCVGKAIDHHG